MAEIGLIASVIQVAGAGLTLSQTLYQYAESVSAAEKRIKDIARDVKLTSRVIEELGSIFKQDDTASLLSENAVSTAQETVRECSSVFEEMDTALKKSTKNKLGKFMLPFREPKLELLRANIDRLKSTLQLLMQVLIHAYQVASHKVDKNEVTTQRNHIKVLIKAKKDSTKRYQESLRNYSMSDENTVVNDDEFIQKTREPDAITDTSVGSLTIASSLGSTITKTSLESCVAHIQKLLSDIDLVQQALTSKVDGEEAFEHEQKLVGSYFSARKHLDNIILGGSGSRRTDSGLSEATKVPRRTRSRNRGGNGYSDGSCSRSRSRSRDTSSRKGDQAAKIAVVASVLKGIRARRQPIPRNREKVSRTNLPYRVRDKSVLDEEVLAESKPEIEFQDGIGRSHLFPWQLAQTWNAMKDLINAIFAHVDGWAELVASGAYDLVSSDGEIILAQFWESLIEPGMSIKMIMWSIPPSPTPLESHAPPHGLPVDPEMLDFAFPPPKKSKKSKRKSRKSSRKIAQHHDHPMMMQPLPSPPLPPPSRLPPPDAFKEDPLLYELDEMLLAQRQNDDQLPEDLIFNKIEQHRNHPLPPPSRTGVDMEVVNYSSSREDEVAPLVPFLFASAGAARTSSLLSERIKMPIDSSSSAQPSSPPPAFSHSTGSMPVLKLSSRKTSSEIERKETESSSSDATILQSVHPNPTADPDSSHNTRQSRYTDKEDGEPTAIPKPPSYSPTSTERRRLAALSGQDQIKARMGRPLRFSGKEDMVRLRIRVDAIRELWGQLKPMEAEAKREGQEEREELIGKRMDYLQNHEYVWYVAPREEEMAYEIVAKRMSDNIAERKSKLKSILGLTQYKEQERKIHLEEEVLRKEMALMHENWQTPHEEQRPERPRPPQHRHLVESPPPLPDTVSKDDHSDDSDLEAITGLEAMRMTEAQDDEAQKRSAGVRSFSSFTARRPPRHVIDSRKALRPDQGSTSDTDYEAIDMGLFDGGYDHHLSYGGRADQLVGHVTKSSVDRDYQLAAEGEKQLQQWNESETSEWRRQREETEVRVQEAPLRSQKDEETRVTKSSAIAAAHVKYKFEFDSKDSKADKSIDGDLDTINSAAQRLNALAKATDAEVRTQNHIARLVSKTDKVDDQISVRLGRLDRLSSAPVSGAALVPMRAAPLPPGQFSEAEAEISKSTTLSASNDTRTQSIDIEAEVNDNGDVATAGAAEAGSAKECYKCGLVGHIARHCTRSSQGGGYGGGTGGTSGYRQVICYVCGNYGHMSRDCTRGQTCYNCGEVGHIVRDCPLLKHNEMEGIDVKIEINNDSQGEEEVGDEVDELLSEWTTLKKSDYE